MAEEVDALRSLLQSFFAKITVDQWKSLVSGSPDNATKILVAELILNLVSTVTQSVLTVLRSLNVPEPEEAALSHLGESFPQSFSEALGVPEQVDSGCWRGLTRMIQEEAQENLSLVLSSPAQTNQRIISPSKLDIMVCHTIKLFKKYESKMNTLFSLRRSKHREEDVTKQEEVEDLELVDPDECESSGGPEKISSVESIQNNIQKVLSDIITPLLDDVSDSEYKKLQSETSLEIQSVAEEVATLLCEKKKKQPFKAVRKKMKSLFGRCFLKVWLCRVLAQVKKKHPQDIRAESCESVDSIIEGLSSQLLLGEPEESGRENIWMAFKHLPSDKVLVFTQELSNLIFGHTFSGPVPDSVLESQSEKKWPVPQSHAEIYMDIRREAWICVVIMNWFLETEAQRLSEQVNLPDPDTKPDYRVEELIADASPRRRTVGVSQQGSGENAATEREEEHEDVALQINKTYVKCLVGKVVFHMCVEAKVMLENRYRLINEVFKKVWAEVQGEPLYITTETFKNLDKKIHQSLCRPFKCGEPLCLITAVDPVMVDLIISLIRKQLMMPPKELNSVHRFFSSLGNALCKSFRCRTRLS